MKVRIVERPLVDEARAKHFSAGSVHDVVEIELRSYSKESWPNARAANIVETGRLKKARVVRVRIPDGEFKGLLIPLLPHEYELVVTPAAATDAPELRVTITERIEKAILGFARAHAGQEFRAEELRAHVRAECGEVAPGSPDRILRGLRQSGVVTYECVSQPKSIYRFAASPLTDTKP